MNYLNPIFMLIALVAVLGCSGSNESKEPKKETDASKTKSEQTQDSIEGKWKVTSMGVNGKTQSPQNGMPEVLEIAKGSFNATSGGQPIPNFSNMKFAVNDRSNPIQFDLIRTKDGREESLPCLAEVDRNKLKLAMPMIPASKAPNDPLPRPKSFDTTKEKILVMLAERFED